MYLSVRIQAGEFAGNEPCKNCETGRGTKQLVLQDEKGEDVVGPFCVECWGSGEFYGVALLGSSARKKAARPPSKRDKRRARRQELELAEETGGRTQPASGAMARAKGDVRKRGVYRGESKFTRSKAFLISRRVLDKISSECQGTEYPVVDICFLDETGRTEDRWVTLPFDTWKKLLEQQAGSPPLSSETRLVAVDTEELDAASNDR